MAGRFAEVPPSDNIYIDGLPADIDETFVRDVFSSYGTVLSCKAMPGKRSGQKGAALVRFESVTAAEWVVGTLNGKIPEGLTDYVAVRFANQSKAISSKPVVVAPGAANGGSMHSQNGWARSSPYPGAAAAPAMAGRGDFADNMFVGDNVYIDGLPAEVDEMMVKELFSTYGNVVSCKAMQAKRLGQKGAALVRWASVEEAEWVVNNLNGKVPDGLEEEIAVRFAKPGKSASFSNSGSPGGGAPLQPLHVPPPHHMPPPHQPAPSWHGAAPHHPEYSSAPQMYGVSSSDIEEVVAGFYRSGQLPGGYKVEDSSLYVVGLPRNTTELELYKIFSTFGALAQKGVTAKYGPDGFCTGVAFVDFLDRVSADQAITILNNSTMPDGTVLNVRFKKPKNR
jgi:RNA recognition motif-containing protein